MEGPSTVSSDILGIEIGRDVVRGVLLDNDTSTVIAAAESAIICDRRFRPDGIVSTRSVGPAINDLLYRLRIDHNARVRTGITIGPKHSGVGSGPALPQWLDEQAQWLEEAMLCSGNVGVSFAPARAVHAVIALCRQVGLEPTRIDLAAVAAARLLGEEVEDAITLGSGRGWRARLRDFEVLEAIELADLPADEPLRVIRRDGLSGPITKYHKAGIAEELFAVQRIDLGQLAPAVGSAVGVLHGSPGNLLLGRSVAYRKKAASAIPAVTNGQAMIGPAMHGPATNGQVMNGQAMNGPVTNGQVAGGRTQNGQAANGDRAGHEVVEPSADSLAAAFRMPAHGVDPAYRFDGRTDTTELRITTSLSPLNNRESDQRPRPERPARTEIEAEANLHASQASHEPDPAPHHEPATRPFVEAPSPVTASETALRSPSHEIVTATNPVAAAVDVVERTGAGAEHDQDLIEMFKPDPEAEKQIRRAAGNRSFGLVLSILIVAALALAVAYTYL